VLTNATKKPMYFRFVIFVCRSISVLQLTVMKAGLAL